MRSIRNKKRPIFLSSSRHPRLLSAPAFISSWDVCSTGAEAGRTTSHRQTFGPRQDARACHRRFAGACDPNVWKNRRGQCPMIVLERLYFSLQGESKNTSGFRHRWGKVLSMNLLWQNVYAIPTASTNLS